MPDISAIAAALQALHAATETAKHIKSSVKSLEGAQIKLQLAELTEALADLKIALADVKDENVNLRSEISELKTKKSVREYLVLKDNAYWPKEGQIEGYGSGPWCSKCFDSSGVLISLHHKLASAMAMGNASFSSYKWQCPECKSSVRAPEPDGQ